MGVAGSILSEIDLNRFDATSTKRSRLDSEQSADAPAAPAPAPAVGLLQLGRAPPDLLSRIFSHFGPVHCSTVLVLVNKHWQQVSAHPRLYTDLSQMGKASWLRNCTNNRQLIARLREPRCKLVEALTVPKLKLGSSTFQKIAKACWHIKYLNICNGCNVKAVHLQEVAKHMPDLTTFVMGEPSGKTASCW